MLSCHAFSSDELERTVAVRSGLRENASPADQVRFLGSYLNNQKPRARSFVVEDNYVDRHYLEEYSGYYGTKLVPPSSKAVRLHFFARELTDVGLDALLERAAQGQQAHRDVCDELNRDYLGYAVIRPLPAAPVGRTVLRPYPAPANAANRRCFTPASTLHDVHLAGLLLRVEGLPFQQQEQAVGACATTAIWSALARVARMDGGRSPTPLAVTLAATRHYLTDRAFPAVAGLDRTQMLAALREFGYSPYVLQARIDELDLFQLALKCYLRSGIPVILRVIVEGSGHAVTVVGFREEDADDTARDIQISHGNSPLRARGLSRLYLHDDRLGPYSRVKWLATEEMGSPGLELYPYEAGFEEFKAPMWVSEAIVPHYPKLRLTATDLVRFAAQMVGIVRVLAGKEKRELLQVDLRFALGQRYLAELFASSLSPARVREFIKGCRLSRYVGIARFAIEDEPFLDVIYDTTDIRRDAVPWASIVALVPYRESDLGVLRSWADSEGLGIAFA